jgi:hypothetical protein
VIDEKVASKIFWTLQKVAAKRQLERVKTTEIVTSQVTFFVELTLGVAAERQARD